MDTEVYTTPITTAIESDCCAIPSVTKGKKVRFNASATKNPLPTLVTVSIEESFLL